MMRIGIEINGVLRNTFEKIKHVYQKNLIDSQTIESQPTYNIDISGDTQDLITNEDFKYEILSEEESFDLEKMYKFQNKEPKFLVNNMKKAMINKTITLQEPITNGQARVKIGDGHWTVTGPDLPIGSKVKVVEVSGNSLVVELVK